MDAPRATAGRDPRRDNASVLPSGEVADSPRESRIFRPAIEPLTSDTFRYRGGAEETPARDHAPQRRPASPRFAWARCNGSLPQTYGKAGVSAARPTLAPPDQRRGTQMELVRPSYARAGATCNGSEAHPVYGSVSNLQPTPNFPGLWVAAVPMPRAAFACVCGHIEHAAGRADVHQLVARQLEHRALCRGTVVGSGVGGGRFVARCGCNTLTKNAKRPGGLIPSRF